MCLEIPWFQDRIYFRKDESLKSANSKFKQNLFFHYFYSIFVRRNSIPFHYWHFHKNHVYDKRNRVGTVLIIIRRSGHSKRSFVYLCLCFFFRGVFQYQNIEVISQDIYEWFGFQYRGDVWSSLLIFDICWYFLVFWYWKTPRFFCSAFKTANWQEGIDKCLPTFYWNPVTWTDRANYIVKHRDKLIGLYYYLRSLRLNTR